MVIWIVTVVAVPCYCVLSPVLCPIPSDTLKDLGDVDDRSSPSLFQNRSLLSFVPVFSNVCNGRSALSVFITFNFFIASVSKYFETYNWSCPHSPMISINDQTGLSTYCVLVFNGRSLSVDWFC